MTPSDIIAVRKYLKMTQAQLAEALGVTRTHVSRLEMRDGRYRPSATIIRLLESLVRQASRPP